MASNGHPDCGSQVWSIIESNKNNLTALRTTDAPPWVSASEFRGTMAILQSCVLTLIACIYTAIHLNVPEKPDWLSVLLTKAQWVILALLAPEIVLYSAASQFLAAFAFRKQLRELQSRSETADKEFEFGMKYAFFVVMGGVRIEASKINRFLSPRDIDQTSEWVCMNDKSKEALFSDQTPERTLQLTPQGILDLSKYGCWVYIPKLKIDARSKADQIQKALVLVQVSWLALQCIARRGYGLPLTLLEVHTMVHVLCAVILYFFWFEKPLDVRDAEIVYNPSWDNALALLVQKTMYHSRIQSLKKYSIPDNVQLVAPTGIYPGPEGAARAIIDRNRAICQQLNCPILPIVISADDEDLTPESLNRFRAIDALFDRQVGKVEGDVSLNELVFNGPPNAPCEEERGFSQRTPNLGFSGQGIQNLGSSIAVLTIDLQALFQATMAIPGLLLLSMVLPVVYGGIHLSAWDFEFPTRTERLLWKVASIGIAATLSTLFSLGMGMKIFLEILKAVVEFCLRRRQSKRAWRDVGEKIYPVLGVVAMVFYVLSRVFIVVESFVALRRVPIGVYWTPAWLQMIPHV